MSKDENTRPLAAPPGGPGLSITGALLVFVLIVLMFWVWWSFFALNKVQTYKVLYSSGEFSIDGAAPGAPDAAPVNASGAVFNTGADGFATLRLSDGSTLRIMPRTRLEVVDARSNSAGDRIRTALRMLSGELVSRVARGDDREREVSLYSKSVAIGVRGTVFGVQESAGAARLTVTEGKVEASGGQGRGLLVKAGEGTVIHAGQAPEPVSALLPAPQLQSPGAGASGGPKGLNLSWEAVPGAARYIVEVAGDSAFYRLLRRREVSWRSGTLAALKRDGEYFWRVAAIDGRGLRGRFSDARGVHHDAYYQRSREALAQLQVGAVLKNLDRAQQGLDEEIDKLRARGFSLLGAGEAAAAKESLSVVLQLRPDDREAKNGMGRANYLLLDYAAARSRYQEALGEGAAGADAGAGLGLIDVREGKFAQALARMHKLLQQFPDHSGALQVAAMAAIGLNRPDQAAVFIARALEINPADATALDLRRSLEATAAPDLQLPAGGAIALPEELQRQLRE